MKKLTVLVSVVVSMFLFAGLVLLIAFATGADSASSNPDRAVANQPGQTEMLESDQRMLERMRVSNSPNMATMIDQNPMWVDSDMIRRQEQNQAQLDRMIGHRPGQP